MWDSGVCVCLGVLGRGDQFKNIWKVWAQMLFKGSISLVS